MVSNTLGHVAVLFGGRSSEHPVSCWSAANVEHGLREAGYDVSLIGISRNGDFRFLAEIPKGDNPEVLEDSGSELSVDSLRHFDAVFPVLHGPYGEDGTIQGLLASLGVPYVGCPVNASSMCMYKHHLKLICDSLGIAQTKYMVLSDVDLLNNFTLSMEQLAENLTFPLFIKPSAQGSSVGITMATNMDELKVALDTARKYDRTILVEESVGDAREIECAVYGLDTPYITAPGEIQKETGSWYDFDNKYRKPTKVSYHADVPEEIVTKSREIISKLWRIVGLRGLSRFDFFYTKEGELLLNEVNTMPGFTAVSLFPKLAEEAGLSLDKLVKKLVDEAIMVAKDNSPWAP